jgi:membrane-bound lytic murein transglycosylase A
MFRPSIAAAIIACAAALAAGCTTAPPPAAVHKPELPPLRPVAPSAMPGWQADDLDGLKTALARQCAMRTPPSPWPMLCAELAGVPATGMRGWLETRFDAWPLRDAQGDMQGLITGYYEPLLTGSRSRESKSQVPLYSRPPDLITVDLSTVEPRLAGMRLRGRLDGQRLVPYHSRAEIETTAPLAGKELIWIDDAIDAFFLEIQGSGRVQLRDGSIARIGYADQNGHPYRAIGRALIDRGAMTAAEVSAPSIKRWLRANPAAAIELMRSNPSHVFFADLPPLPVPTPGEPEAGPPGSLGVPLTALRSLAVDRSVVPLGSLVYLDTVHPLDASAIQRLMTAQDTGGAIVGKIRADVFWGFGPQAEQAAGEMKARGRMWMLWPKGETPPTLVAPR